MLNLFVYQLLVLSLFLLVSRVWPDFLEAVVDRVPVAKR